MLDGPEFRRAVLDADGGIRQHVFDAVWRRLRVLARCSPADKFTIVKGVHTQTPARDATSLYFPELTASVC